MRKQETITTPGLALHETLFHLTNMCWCLILYKTLEDKKVRKDAVKVLIIPQERQIGKIVKSHKCPDCLFDPNLYFSTDKPCVTGRSSQGSFTGAQKDWSLDSASVSLITTRAKHRDQLKKKQREGSGPKMTETNVNRENV